ncbi:MAG: cadherin-like domain-containing protein, partial [Hyphomicrobium sp.]
VATFTQADLERGSVLFLHDGTDTPDASFDVVVADKAGATSGAAQTVKVAVRGHA